MPKYAPLAIDNYTPVLNPKPPPTVTSVTQQPTVCIEISEELIAYILGLLEVYRWPDKFRGTAQQQNDAAELFVDLMRHIAVSQSCAGALRQNGCVLEQQAPGGVWQPAFDFGQALREAINCEMNLVKVTQQDTNSGYLGEKILAGDNAQLNIVTNELGNQTITVRAEGVQTTETIIQHNSQPLTIAKVAKTGTQILEIRVLVEQPFNQGSAISCGVTGNENLFMSSAAVDLTAEGSYLLNIYYECQQETNIYIAYTRANSPLAGVARVLISYKG